MKRYLFLITVFITLAGVSCKQKELSKTRILVFTKTLEFHHESIKDGIAMFEKLGRENGFIVDTTQSANVFTDDSLKKYNAIVFLSTTGDILDHAQQTALQRYIEAGGGFMGVHGASGSEYKWPWFGKLVGAWFESHPPQLQKGTIHLADSNNSIVKGLPSSWSPVEEWYNFQSISPDIKVLATVDESTYEGGKHGSNHPIFWYQGFDGGRSFYTALGHRPEAYSDPVFVKHILNGLQYVIGNNVSLDYSKSHTLAVPDEDHFVRNVFVEKGYVQEPMELAVTKDGFIFYVERRGNIRLYDPKTKLTSIVGTIPVYAEHEDGLLGLTLDPDYENNHWMYVFYSAPANEFNYHLSRFTFDPEKKHVDADSEKVILKIHEEHSYSNHTGGSLAFDKEGNLYLSVGDNTIPFDSKGYAPIDERKDRTEYDAERSSGNTNDLRGKIIRIHPQPDGSYTIPEGNLFAKGTPKTRPEIYVMGNRNPFRISIDPKTNFLYWGEVGPDANKDSLEGPRGYDEVNQARKAGNFGWPFFVADNKPYAYVNFTTGAIGKLYDENAPVNTSPRNTGLKILPPAQKALIYYPYKRSKEFPLVGSGGRTAMAGPVYHYDENLKSAIKLPKYYDKGLFIYDWARNWIMVVRMDHEGNYQSMEPFMPSTSFAAIIDMELGPDGALYILEYGNVWYQSGVDARLSRIEFNDSTSQSRKVNLENARPVEQSAKLLPKPKGYSGIGDSLIMKSGCMSCHQLNQTSVGPEFVKIADRYKNKPGDADKLADKVIAGGAGVWGKNAMSAHPQLTKQEALQMVRYILSLDKN